MSITASQKMFCNQVHFSGEEWNNFSIFAIVSFSLFLSTFFKAFIIMLDNCCVFWNLFYQNYMFYLSFSLIILLQDNPECLSVSTFSRPLLNLLCLASQCTKQIVVTVDRHENILLFFVQFYEKLQTDTLLSFLI